MNLKSCGRLVAVGTIELPHPTHFSITDHYIYLFFQPIPYLCNPARNHMAGYENLPQEWSTLSKYSLTWSTPIHTTTVSWSRWRVSEVLENLNMHDKTWISGIVLVLDSAAMMCCPNGGTRWAFCVGATRVIPSHPFWIQRRNCTASRGHGRFRIYIFVRPFHRLNSDSLEDISIAMRTKASTWSESDGAYYLYPLAHIFSRHGQDVMPILLERGHFEAAYSDLSPTPWKSQFKQCSINVVHSTRSGEEYLMP